MQLFLKGWISVNMDNFDTAILFFDYCEFINIHLIPCSGENQNNQWKRSRQNLESAGSVTDSKERAIGNRMDIINFISMKD